MGERPYRARFGLPSRRRLGAAGLATALLAAVAAGAAEREVAVVVTPGEGTLTKCRDWLIYRSCDTYHHVALPARVEVGDEFVLTFGHSLKQYTFHVATIRQNGERCAILNGDGADADRIVVAPCRPR